CATNPRNCNSSSACCTTWRRPRSWTPSSAMPQLEVVGFRKSFGARSAVDGVSFNVAEGEVLALLGPSGSGKSTLLSLIAGLEAPDAGDLLWDGQSLLAIPTHQRGCGLMFQDYALFPHKDVTANVGFGLRMQGQSRADIETGVQ